MLSNGRFESRSCSESITIAPSALRFLRPGAARGQRMEEPKEEDAVARKWQERGKGADDEAIVRP
jgi:hypothetical protein